MKSRFVIPSMCFCLLLSFIVDSMAAADPELKRKVDSLFVIASSGELKYRDMTEPAMDSVAALGVEAVPILIDKFTTKSARERWTVIWILQRIGSPAVPDLVGALQRPEGLVVQRVCWALGDIADTASVLPLVGVVNHPRWQVREQAIGALGKVGDRRAGEAVMSGLTDTIGQVRKSAVVSCGKLKVQESIGQLIHTLGDDYYGARLSAIDALLKMDSSKVLAALTDSLSSENALVGHLGCHVLGEIGTDPAIELLLNQTKSPDAERRAHAAMAIIKADPYDNCGYRQMLLDRETDRFARLKIQSTIDALSNDRQ